MAKQSRIPNLVVVLRTAMILGCLPLLNADNFNARMWGILVMAAAGALDGVDGYLARKLDSVTAVGAKLDTMGDRITENVLFVFLAYKGIVPLFVPVIFVTRSFFSDFIRSLHDRRGVSGTFAMNTSPFGRAVVASRTSRAAYLILKFGSFLSGGAFLAAGAADAQACLTGLAGSFFRMAGFTAVAATAVCLLRLTALVRDSWEILKEDLGF